MVTRSGQKISGASFANSRFLNHVVYNLILFLYLLLLLPKLLIDRIKGKQHPALLQRLGASIPDSHNRPVIWIHGVSVGEIKSAAPLFLSLKIKYPNAFFLITTTTATGQAEAKRSLPQADAFRYLPLDFSWITRRWAKKLRPKLFLLIESDFWPNLLLAIQRGGGKNILVSGKLSERSAFRFRLLSPFSRRLFHRFDLLLVQNQIHFDRFLPIAPPSRLFITGNLKFDHAPQHPDTTFWENKITLPIVTIASTHAPEEELILDALKELNLFLFLAPRHPERFDAVAALLTQKQIPFVRWSQPNLKQERVVLIDTMGQLPTCYSLSSLAIIGGSFVPHVGGHNIFEPCLYSIPVLFGPHMSSQIELVTRILEGGAGRQVSIDQLKKILLETLADSSMRKSAEALAKNSRGAVEKTLRQIDHLFFH